MIHLGLYNKRHAYNIVYPLLLYRYFVCCDNKEVMLTEQAHLTIVVQGSPGVVIYYNHYSVMPKHASSSLIIIIL